VDWQKIAYFLVGLFIGVVFHEYMHGRIADYLGDNTARKAGRLTLNPIPHIDPFGTILLPIALILISRGTFSFGYAKPVPVNPYFMRKPRRDMALVALAGPVTNFVLAAVITGIAAVLRLGFSLQFYVSPDGKLISGSGAVWADLFMLLASVAVINVILGIFNLIPIPPLDGSHMLEYFLSPRATEVYETIGRYGFVIIFLFLLLLGDVFFGLMQPIFHLIETGVFGSLIAVF